MIVNLWTAPAEPFTSQAEERLTIVAAKAGDESAKERLIRAYLPALRNAVGRLAPTSHYGRVMNEDARQAAILGLFEAVAAFDPQRYSTLAGLAPRYIKGALSALADGLHAHDVPERTRERYEAVMRAANGDAEVAAALAPDYDLAEKTFREIHLTRNPFGASAPKGADRGGITEDADFAGERDMLGSADTPWSVREFGAVEDAILSRAALNTLDPDEREIVALSYGLATGEPLSVRDVAERVGRSKSSVARTLAHSLASMRLTLGALV